MNAVILGSTGAVGTQLTKALLAESSIQSIKLLVRRKHPDSEISSSSKVSQLIVDVLDPSSYKAHLTGCELAFSTFGVGEPTKVSKEEFLKIDYEAVKQFSTACKASGILHFSSLGSVGANPKSRFYYLRVKGQLEQFLTELKFNRLSLFRPSMILTPTNRYGFSQAVTLKFFPLLHPLLAGNLSQYKGIRVELLGKAMARNALQPSRALVETLTWKNFQP